MSEADTMVAMVSKNAAEPKARRSEYTAENKSCRAELYLDNFKIRSKRKTRKIRKSSNGKNTCK